MNNSLVTHLSRYVTALFADVRYAYTRESDWVRDQSRLTHETEANGMRTLAIDLPSLAKHFYKCLDQGQYTPSGLRLSAMTSKRIQVPAFLRNLYLQVFDSEGKLRDEPSLDAIHVIITITRTLSKAKFQCSKKALRDEVRNFKSIEEELKTPTRNWVGDHILDDYDRSATHFSDLSIRQASGGLQLELLPCEESYQIPGEWADILQRVADRISSSLGDFHNESPRELPKHGPGRVSNQKVGVSKYHFSEWSAKVEAVFPYDLYARTDFGYGIDRKRDRMRPNTSESPSKLIAVPKTMAGPRLIASEPNQHQWLQGLVANQLHQRSKNTVLSNCISIDDQSHNGRMASMASRTGSHATVDLKSASDRLSCWAVERLFRANPTLLQRIAATRTRRISNCIDSTIFNQLVLKKCFTQGNALTFPVQSISYAIVAIASVLIADKARVSTSAIEDASYQVRVFGDDIVIPTHALVILVKLLEALQLRVNYSKTFSKGKFRESCGVDAYDGVDVTPVFVKTVSLRPRHEQADSVVASVNNLFDAGMWNVSEWLRSTVRSLMLPIVRSRDPGMAYQAFSGSSHAHLKSRWNEDLQRKEIRTHRLVSTSDTEDQPGTYKLFDFFIEKHSSRENQHLSHLRCNEGSDRMVIRRSASVMKQGWSPAGWEKYPVYQ